MKILKGMKDLPTNLVSKENFDGIAYMIHKDLTIYAEYYEELEACQITLGLHNDKDFLCDIVYPKEHPSFSEVLKQIKRYDNLSFAKEAAKKVFQIILKDLTPLQTMKLIYTIYDKAEKLGKIEAFKDIKKSMKNIIG